MPTVLAPLYTYMTDYLLRRMLIVFIPSIETFTSHSMFSAVVFSNELKFAVKLSTTVVPFM